jgi:hypothetical protein
MLKNCEHRFEISKRSGRLALVFFDQSGQEKQTELAQYWDDMFSRFSENEKLLLARQLTAMLMLAVKDSDNDA